MENIQIQNNLNILKANKEFFSTIEKQNFVEKFFEVYPNFRIKEFDDMWKDRLSDTILKKYSIAGRDVGLLFFSHNGLYNLNKKELNFFRKGNVSRFVKSLLLDWNSLKIISLGLPMMASIDSNNANSEQLMAIKECSNPTYTEKIDGVCLLATRSEDFYIIKSRRTIYYANSNLDNILSINDFNVGKQLQMLIDGEWERLGPFSVCFECIFPHPFFHSCDNEVFSTILKNSPYFTPYVAYNYNKVYLTSIIKHNGEFVTQSETDVLAEKYSLPRAKNLKFNSIEDTMQFLKTKTNHEGLISYIDDDQTPLKWKTQWYKNTNRVCSTYAMLRKSYNTTNSPINSSIESPMVISSKLIGLDF
jgi:hypothetical protein